MANIFISYASEDCDRVEPLVALLEGAGYSVWWDKHLQGGTVYSKKIEAEIQKAELVVVIWTQASARSQWVADEAEIGRRQSKLLPVALDGIEPPIGFRQIHTVALTTDAASGKILPDLMTRLTDAVAHQLASKQDASPASSSAPAASIAVLPFVNMSSDPEQEYFSDGISEELLNLLSKNSAMHVTARTSSFQFKNKNFDISKIGKILGVAQVLEGSVRKAGNRIRITAQLIEVATGFHQWSETYDRTLDDIFAIQDEISAAIVEALKVHILGEVDAPVATRSISTRAYEYYLRGQHSISPRTQASLEKARESFQASLDLDPDFLPAMTGLADVYLLLSDDDICYGRTPVAEALALALPVLEKALAQNPDSEEVHALRSFYFHLSGDADQAQIHAKKAITLNPNCSRAYRTLGLSLKRSGNPHALVIKTREKVLQLDPASPTDLINLFIELPARSRLREAKMLLDRIEDIERGSIFNAWGRFSIAWHRGNLKECLAVYAANEKLLQDRQWFENIQPTLTLFGYGKQGEKKNPIVALRVYLGYGFTDDAHRVAHELSERPGYSPTDIPTLTRAYLLIQDERWKDADALLRPLEESDPEKWGSLFNLEDFCLGARLSWLVRKKLGDQQGSQHIEKKLKELYAVRQFDYEGVHKATNYIGACIASMDGDRQAALDEIRTLTDRFPASSLMIFFDPLVQNLLDAPEFRRMKQQVLDQIAKQKNLAEAAGLLPPPETFFSTA